MAMTEQEKQFFRAHKFKFKGRVFYPNLLTPKANKEGTRSSFNGMFAFKPEENQAELQKLAAFLGEAYNKFWPGFPLQNWVNPLKKFDTYRKENGQQMPDYLKGYYWINAATGMDMPPAVVGAGVIPGTFVHLKAENGDESKIYSGKNGVFQISFYKIPRNKQGLSANIEAFMCMEGGANEGGSGGVNVEDAFAGFMGATTSNMQAPTPSTGAQPSWDQPATNTTTAPKADISFI